MSPIIAYLLANHKYIFRKLTTVMRMQNQPATRQSVLGRACPQARGAREVGDPEAGRQSADVRRVIDVEAAAAGRRSGRRIAPRMYMPRIAAPIGLRCRTPSAIMAPISPNSPADAPTETAGLHSALA